LGGSWHVYVNQLTFAPIDIKQCYDGLHEQAPGSFSGYFKNLVSQQILLKSKAGYRLAGPVRDALAAEFAPSGHRIAVTNLLRDLPARIPDLAERTFLDETLTCYEHTAFRASVVMAWNLAYHHLCDFVIRNRLADFNGRWPIKFPGHHRSGAKTIAVVDDFMQELRLDGRSFGSVSRDKTARASAQDDDSQRACRAFSPRFLLLFLPRPPAYAGMLRAFSALKAPG
jgi:hypothetical protein